MTDLLSIQPDPVWLTRAQAIDVLLRLGCPMDRAEALLDEIDQDVREQGPTEFDTGPGNSITLGASDRFLDHDPTMFYWVRSADRPETPGA